MLGVNGAGKTTIFKMLTGALNITEGDAYIKGKRYIFKGHPGIGYYFSPTLSTKLNLRNVLNRHGS